MAARKASHPVVVKLLVKNTLDRTLRENIFKGACFSGPGCQSLSPEIVLVLVVVLVLGPSE
jgi:hypothetical protein